ncbi:MAG: hypothetical protein IPL61_28405 [Myxococcales bacterium]|nr:hypothetical protein [Myxococcales bacterium]
MGDRDALRGGNTYEDHVVAYRAARMLADALAGVDGVCELRREDKRFPGFDDVSETSHRGGRPWIQSWQIKSGALDAKQLTACLRQASTAACDEPTLGFGEWFEVDGHNLRRFGALCRRTRAGIVDTEQLWSTSSRLDRAWLDWVATELAMPRVEVVALLGRLSVERLGNLDEVDDLARDSLARQLPQTDVVNVHNALIDVVARLRKQDVVTPDGLARLLESRCSSFAPLGGDGGVRAKYLSSVARRWRAHQPLDSLDGAGTWTSSVRSASVFVPAHVIDEARRRLARPEKNDGGRAPDGSDGDLEIEAVLSRLSRERCVALVGDVGTGKSTLLAWCAHHLGERAVRDVAAPMPLLVHARELRRYGWPEVVSSGTPSLRLSDYSASWVLLVDGVDEVGSSVWQQLDIIRGDELRLAPGRRGARLAGLLRQQGHRRFPVVQMVLQHCSYRRGRQPTSAGTWRRGETWARSIEPL